jgi:hypothetical protein
MQMKKIFLVISLIWLFCGISGTIASAMGKDAGERPFVGMWHQLNEKGIFTLDLDLYRSKGAGGYGFYQTSEYDGEWLSKDFFGSIDEVSLIEDNSAEVIIKSGDLKQKAHIGYNSVSCQLTFRVNDSDAIIFSKEDRCEFVHILDGKNINVRSAPVSGTPLMKANRGQNFRFLGIEDGWYKVQLSPIDKRIGYIHSDYVEYMGDNTIPDDVFDKSYSGDMTNISLQKNGRDVVLHLSEMFLPRPDGSIIPSYNVTYAGYIDGNTLVVTHQVNGYENNPDRDKMDKIKPFVVYYDWKLDMFLMNDKEYFIE